jgi:enoyl-CoA hydratase/carnithine racemase
VPGQEEQDAPAAALVGAEVLAQRLGPPLDALERLYLDELMQSADALEGLRAFLEKREPRWTGR